MLLKSLNLQKKSVKTIKKVIQKLLFPPVWAVIAISVIGYILLISAFSFNVFPDIFIYVIYLLSAYSLTIDILAFPKFIKTFKNLCKYISEHSRIIKCIKSTKFGSRFFNDMIFRGNISIYQGMTVNFLYTVFRIISGIKYSSVWFISLAVYYFILGILRAYLIFCYRRKSGNKGVVYEYKCCKTLGRMLILLNIPMVGIVILMIVQNSGYIYSGITIYLSALYTFYIMILSIINIVKFKSIGSPILLAAKMLNFISAAMSLLGLQTAMIAQFGDGDDAFRKEMNTVTGSGVCLLVIGMAIYMVVKSSKNIKRETLNE